LCQQLTGIAFANEVLSQKLFGRGAPESATAEKIGKLVDDAITQARQLARGLQPVILEAGGLAVALRELCGKLQDTFHVSCIFDCDNLVLIHDNVVATHLYRIAQEAISNSIKHGKAKTIIIELSLLGDRGLVLKISDDGVGLSEANLGGAGIGMHSMAYRARIIGGTLEVQPGARGGTVVTCTIRDVPAATESRDGNKETEDPGGNTSQTRTRATATARGGKEKGAGHRRSSYRSRAPGRAH